MKYVYVHVYVAAWPRGLVARWLGNWVARWPRGWVAGWPGGRVAGQIFCHSELYLVDESR